MKLRPKDWPPEREAELMRRYAAGERLKCIAGAMDLSDEAVTGKVRRLRAQGRIVGRNRPWSPEEDRQLAIGMARGLTPRTMAPSFGRSWEAVHMRCVLLRKRHGALRFAAMRPFAAPPPSPAPLPLDRDQFTLELRAA